MEEMIEYFDRAPRHTSATRWKSVVKQLPPPLCNLADVPSLRPLYSKQTMEAALARVQLVGCGERISIFGLLNVCPVSSGYCLGSCNWVITSEMEKIVYLSSSSTLTTHPKSMDKDSAALKGADCLIMTALTQTPTQMPDPMIGEFCRLVVETLKASGNVLVPCYPSGIIYDLFECLSQQMDMNGLTTVPLFFLSPVADSSLAYSNIMAEWLSTAKHNRVYLPEEPFVHGALQRGGRLKAFPSLEAEAVQSEYRQPCVVFCGHPSLRSGDVVHFLRLWGASPANLVVFTEPSFNHQAALAPFQPLAMKALHCPIDTSLNFTQARKLVRDIRPKMVVVPEKYTVPPMQAPGRTELVIDADVPMYKHKKLDILQLPVKSSLEHIEISSELAARLVPQEVSPGLEKFNLRDVIQPKKTTTTKISQVRPGLAVATVTGQLTVKDNSYSLGLVEEVGDSSGGGKRKRESRSSSVGPPNKFPLGKSKAQHYLYGPLDHQVKTFSPMA